MRRILRLPVAVAAFLVCSLVGVQHFIGGATKSAGFSARLLRDGDLLFQESRSNQSDAIRDATGSEWTHVGVCWTVDGRFEIVEAAGSHVRSVSIDDFVRRGKAQRLVVLRLRDADRRLDGEALRRLHEELRKCIGRPYDSYFSWDDPQLYCSELVWKSYQRALDISLCNPQAMADLNYKAPKVEKLIAVRFRSVPGDARWNEILREKVVTPVALLRSEELVTIYDSDPLPP